jgi:CBS domain-containing protein
VNADDPIIDAARVMRDSDIGDAIVMDPERV